MLARFLTGQILARAAGAVVAIALALAGWQALEAGNARAKLATAQADLATTQASLTKAQTERDAARATLEAERLAAGADLARCLADAQAEAERQYQAGGAAARLSRNCVHDQGGPAVNRSLRDVLGESKP